RAWRALAGWPLGLPSPPRPCHSPAGGGRPRPALPCRPVDGRRDEASAGTCTRSPHFGGPEYLSWPPVRGPPRRLLRQCRAGFVRIPDPVPGNFNDVTQTTRPLPTFSFDAAELGIVSSGLHVVEVVVGETTGFDPASTTFPNRAMLQGYTAATYKFVVDLHLE